MTHHNEATQDVSGMGVTVRAARERYAAWEEVAGDKALDVWLGELADREAGLAAVEEERHWPVVVTLKHPVEFDDRITTLTMRRGRAGDIKGLKLSGELPADQLLLLASRLSGQPTQVIERLDMDDAGEVMAIALGFYAKCLAGGRKRSR